MILTAIYKGNIPMDFIVVPGEVVGKSFRYEGRRPKHFVVPKGLSAEEKAYLKDYCSVRPRYD